MPNNESTVQIDDAQILFPNFEGRKTTFNAKGDRNFKVVIDQETAERMKADGWSVKERVNPYSDDENDIQYTVNVKVNFNSRKPPLVVMLSSRGRTHLDEETISILDQVEIVKADLIINPYHWEVNGSSGVSAYLKTMFVTIYEDALQIRYSEIPEESFDKTEVAQEPEE